MVTNSRPVSQLLADATRFPAAVATQLGGPRPRPPSLLDAVIPSTGIPAWLLASASGRNRRNVPYCSAEARWGGLRPPTLWDATRFPAVVATLLYFNALVCTTVFGITGYL